MPKEQQPSFSPADTPVQQLRVVLAHDWLTGIRGGERVLEQLSRTYPDAPIFTLLHNQGSTSAWLESRRVTTSFLQHLPGRHHYYRHFLPFMPLAAESLKIPPADLLITTSHCAIKGIRPAPGTPHLCYCFTPMRYAWALYHEYFGSNPLKKAVLQPILAYLRHWDRSVSSRVDRFVAISRTVADRIEKYYDRRCGIVYPGVDTDFYTPGADVDPREDYLIVSALVRYKNLHLAIQAFNELQKPLRIIGTGTEYASLKKIAGPTIRFLGRQSDDEVREAYRSCKAFVFPGIEDFGLTPVEAMACGRPVIALGRGGVTESVREGKTGLFFSEPTKDSLAAAIVRFEKMKWDAHLIRGQAENFSVDRFHDGMKTEIQGLLSQFQKP
jgi:glycosyltransferase involved in cell wall biosynthesis